MYQNDMKEKAKKVNIVDFLKKNHPDTILEKKTEVLRIVKTHQ